MQTFVQIPQQYQGNANATNQQIRWTGVGFRAAPAPPPGLSSPTDFYWPRTVLLIDSSSSGLARVVDSGWIPGDFTGLAFKANEILSGTPKTDYWNLWIAESDTDMLSAPGSSLTAGLVYDPVNLTYTSADKTPSVTATITGNVTTIPSGANNLKNTNGTATTVSTNISSPLQGGTGTCLGILVSNTGATINLNLLVTGVIIDVIPPNTGRFYNLDPNSITNIQVAAASSTTTYSATAYYHS